MLEQAVQERFIGFVNNSIAIPNEAENPIRIYKELVHYRFEEVIRNAMPDFSEILGEERLDELIFLFIQAKPQSPFVWKAPLEFMDFLLENNYVDDISYAEDLMWFECIEVELLMGAYEAPKDECFDWEKNFKPTESMRMKSLNHAVNQDVFDFVEAHPLVMYYHFDESSIFFQEITPFMYYFLELLRKHSPLEALGLICDEFGVDEVEDVKALLQEPLETFTQLHILSEVA